MKKQTSYNFACTVIKKFKHEHPRGTNTALLLWRDKCSPDVLKNWIMYGSQRWYRYKQTVKYLERLLPEDKNDIRAFVAERETDLIDKCLHFKSAGYPTEYYTDV